MEDSKTVQTVQYIQQEENGLATSAMVLGIIGFVIGIIPFIGWFAVPLSILAVIFGVLGMRKKTKRGQAIAGLSLGAALLAWKIGFWILIILLGAMGSVSGY